MSFNIYFDDYCICRNSIKNVLNTQNSFQWPSINIVTFQNHIGTFFPDQVWTIDIHVFKIFTKVTWEFLASESMEKLKELNTT